MTINSLRARLVVIMSVIFLVAWLVSTGLAVYSNRATDLKVSDAILQAEELPALLGDGTLVEPRPAQGAPDRNPHRLIPQGGGQRGVSEPFRRDGHLGHHAERLV